MNLWALLADFIRTWIVNLVPRPFIVRKTHGAVKFVRGKKIIELNSGFYFYWPFITEIEVIPIVRQTIRLPTQCLMDVDDHSIIVGAVLVYEIEDVVKALSEVYEIDEAIEDISLATIKCFIVGKRVRGISEKFIEIDKELTQSIRGKLKPLGVKVKNVYLSDCSETMVLKNYGEKFKLYSDERLEI